MSATRIQTLDQVTTENTRIEMTRTISRKLSCLLELVFGFDRFHLPSCGSREASPAQAEQFQALCAPTPIQTLDQVTTENTRIEMTRTISRKLVPQRGWNRG